jgi:hypothetical protein
MQQVDFENTQPDEVEMKVRPSREQVERLFAEARQSRQEILVLVDNLSKTVQEVKTGLDVLKASTTDLVTVFESVQGVSNVLIWLGKVIKPLIWISGIITAAYMFFHNVKIPKVTP